MSGRRRWSASPARHHEPDYLPGREWQAAGDYIYPSLDEKLDPAVRLRCQRGPDAKPNMFAQVVIQAEPLEHALVVPREGGNPHRQPGPGGAGAGGDALAPRS